MYILLEQRPQGFLRFTRESQPCCFHIDQKSQQQKSQPSAPKVCILSKLYAQDQTHSAVKSVTKDSAARKGRREGEHLGLSPHQVSASPHQGITAWDFSSIRRNFPQLSSCNLWLTKMHLKKLYPFSKKNKHSWEILSFHLTYLKPSTPPLPSSANISVLDLGAAQKPRELFLGGTLSSVTHCFLCRTILGFQKWERYISVLTH